MSATTRRITSATAIWLIGLLAALRLKPKEVTVVSGTGGIRFTLTVRSLEAPEVVKLGGSPGGETELRVAWPPSILAALGQVVEPSSSPALRALAKLNAGCGMLRIPLAVNGSPAPAQLPPKALPTNRRAVKKSFASGWSGLAAPIKPARRPGGRALRGRDGDRPGRLASPRRGQGFTLAWNARMTERSNEFTDFGDGNALATSGSNTTVTVLPFISGAKRFGRSARRPPGRDDRPEPDAGTEAPPPPGWAKGAPHSLQNRAASRLEKEQAGHRRLVKVSGKVDSSRRRV